MDLDESGTVIGEGCLQRPFQLFGLRRAGGASSAVDAGRLVSLDAGELYVATLCSHLIGIAATGATG